MMSKKAFYSINPRGKQFELNVYGDKERIDQFIQQVNKWNDNRSLQINRLDHDEISFFEKYPFLCQGRKENLTHQILPNFLFLGDYDSSTDEEILDHLGIHYVINISFFYKTDYQNARECFVIDIEGIKKRNFFSHF